MERSRKEEIILAERICTDACNAIYLEYDIDLIFDHYDDEVKTIYLRERDHSANPSNFLVVQDLEEEIKRRINKKWKIGILFNDYRHSDYNDEEENEYGF